MRRFLSVASGSVFALMCAATSVLAAEGVIGDPNNGRQIFLNGKGDVAACQSCHGEDGTGSDDMGTPRLSNQVYTYILKQLEDFATGKRVDNTLGAMNDVAKGLTEQDRRDVAAYVHSLKTPFLGSDLRQISEADGVDISELGDPAKGRMIVEYGAGDRGIPACKSCHSFHGRSAGKIFPAIQGQRYKYLKHELEAFKEGAQPNYDRETARYNDPRGMMRKVASHLTDEDIKNLAAFLTSALPETPNNPVPPSRERF